MIAALCACIAKADQQFVAQTVFPEGSVLAGRPRKVGRGYYNRLMDSESCRTLATLLRTHRVAALGTLRSIEAEINGRRDEAGRASDIPLTNFRGIELRGFPAEVARLADPVVTLDAASKLQVGIELLGPGLGLRAKFFGLSVLFLFDFEQITRDL